MHALSLKNTILLKYQKWPLIRRLPAVLDSGMRSSAHS
ncbi:MAG: hypothetical protein ACI89D_002433, partial [Bermanella sp.]